MRHFIISAFAIIILSTCSGISKDVQVSPSLTTPVPTHTKAVLPKITAPKIPLLLPSSTPVPLSIILADFPLAVGTTWKYSAEISYQESKDYMKLLKWTGTITYVVVDKKIEQDGKVVFRVQQNLEPKPLEPLVWVLEWEFFNYTIERSVVIEGNRKIYQYPLEDNVRWYAVDGFNDETIVQSVESVNTPYGRLDNCYMLSTTSNSDTLIDVFCKGIGFVKHSYTHHGTPQDAKFILSSFTLGQP